MFVGPITILSRCLLYRMYICCQQRKGKNDCRDMDRDYMITSIFLSFHSLILHHVTPPVKPWIKVQWKTNTSLTWENSRYFYCYHPTYNHRQKSSDRLSLFSSIHPFTALTIKFCPLWDRIVIGSKYKSPFPPLVLMLHSTVEFMPV